jgi:hypothetical protein
MSCLGSETVEAGIDTQTAEWIVHNSRFNQRRVLTSRLPVWALEIPGRRASLLRLLCSRRILQPFTIRTRIAMMSTVCGTTTIQVLDYCGGHAFPYHYHERLSCLYAADAATQHSTRIGVMADGNPLYGPNVDGGVRPTDLDACGGRTGVTPDSNGAAICKAIRVLV